MDSGPEEPIKPRSPLPGIIIAVLLIGGAVAGIAAMRSAATKQKAEADRKARAAASDSAASAARADSIRLATMDTSKVAVASPSPTPGKPGTTPTKPATTAPIPATPAGSTGAAATPKTPAATGGGASAGGATAAPKPAAAGPFGIDVGTFLDEEKANSESARLGTATSLAAKVVTKTEDGASVYHVVLGSFATRSAAEKRSETLVAKGLVNEAHIVPLR